MKRPRTLRSFYAPAITPVIPAQSQENVDINLDAQQSVGTGASVDAHTPIDAPTIDAPTEINFDPPVESHATNEELVFNSTEIVADPGLRKPIEDYHINIRDVVRREYLLRGPCQPISHRYPKKNERPAENTYLLFISKFV